MLIPRFTLRFLLLTTTAAAGFCFLVTLAIREHQWALAVVLALLSLAVAFLFYAITFLLGFGLARVGHLVGRRQMAGSPFASAAPPPQVIVPPQDSD